MCTIDHRRKGSPTGLVAVLLGPALVFATACEGQRDQGEPAAADQEQTAVERDGERGEGEVIERRAEPVEQNGFGETEAEEGETEAQVRERVVTREVRELDVPTVRLCQEYANINEMDAEQLVAIGVPPRAAQSIVQYREESGPFRSMDQLEQVQGVDQNALSTLRQKAAVPPQE